MCSLSTFALLLAITTTLASASPVLKRQCRIRGSIADKTYKCHALPKEVSDYCGYNITVLPNARGHETVGEVLGEFNHFEPLLTDSPCSDHVGVLLCFHYFPFLNCTSGQDVSNTKFVTRPCKETCVAVTETESCTTHVNAATGTGWPPHLNCDTEKNFPTSGVCSNLSATINKNYTVQRPSNSTNDSMPEVTTSASTTPKPEVTNPTETPTTKGPSCPLCPPKTNTCNIRNATNSKSFTRNMKYSYAIKATITQQTGCNTYQIEVHESFDVHTCRGSVMQDPIPIATGTATLHTSDGHCSNLMAKMNTPVLIAGTHTGSGTNGFQLHLGCTRKTGLIADWIPKYTTDLLRLWINNRTCLPPI